MNAGPYDGFESAGPFAGSASPSPPRRCSSGRPAV